MKIAASFLQQKPQLTFLVSHTSDEMQGKEDEKTSDGNSNGDRGRGLRLDLLRVLLRGRVHIGKDREDVEVNMEFFKTFGIMLVVAAIPLILYAFRIAKSDFDFVGFIVYNRSRLCLGGVLILLISILIVWVPEAEAVLTAIGFAPERSSAALGLAIGGMLVAGIQGNDKVARSE